MYSALCIGFHISYGILCKSSDSQCAQNEWTNEQTNDEREKDTERKSDWEWVRERQSEWVRELYSNSSSSFYPLWDSCYFSMFLQKLFSPGLHTPVAHVTYYDFIRNLTASTTQTYLQQIHQPREANINKNRHIHIRSQANAMND